MPEPRDRHELRVPRLRERGRRCRRALDPALHVRFELADERRMRELIGEDGGDAERNGRGDAVALQCLQRFDEREVAIERGFAQPHAAVWPAAVMQDIRKMSVQCENEVHRCSSDGRRRRSGGRLCRR